jgi:hypothetical protein
MRSISPQGALALSAISLCAATANAQSFTFQTVKLPGALSTNPVAFGSGNQIVGYEAASTLKVKGFVESGSAVKTVSVAGSVSTELYNYSNGLYIGQEDAKGGAIKSFMTTASGTMSPIVFPGSSDTWAYGINASHTIVGQYEALVGPVQQIGFSYSNGVFTSIQIPNAVYTNVSGINDAGTMVGSYELFSSPTSVGFMLQNGQLTTIAVPGAYETTVMGINNEGEIVGYYSTSPNSGNVGFVYDGTSFTSFTAPGGTSTYAYNVNDAGQVVGFVVGTRGDSGYIATPVTATR